MFDQIIALFERLVIAHEKLAASQEAILRVTDVRIVDDPKPETTEEKPKATRAKKEKPVEAPKVEETKPAPKPKLTLSDVKAAVAGYASARMEAGSAAPKNDARALMAHFGGGAAKTDAISEEYWQDVIDACNSGWEPVPAKDEEL